MSYRLLLVFLLAASLLLNVPRISKSRPLQIARLGTQAIFYPINSLPSAVLNTVKSLVRMRRAEEDNQELRLKLSAALAENRALALFEAENEKLNRALGFGRAFGYQLIPARVIGRSGDTWLEQITINKGSSHGVRSGQTVVCREGLVGRVRDVSRFTSRVELVTSPGLTISAVLPRTQTFGMVNGGYGSVLKLRYVQEAASVEAGEAVVVGAGSQTIAPHIPLGRVKRAERSVEMLFQDIEVAPLADLSKLDVVFICRQ
ncbi:rod shape-determining protein MreC [Candidatus Saganbacteria bacterium]|nr:rod shape-determining protein MreC [Candidatus Saganbacteria bacterium]